MEIIGKLIKKEDIRSGVGKSGRQWQLIKFVVAQKGYSPTKELDLVSFSADVVSFISDTDII